MTTARELALRVEAAMLLGRIRPGTRRHLLALARRYLAQHPGPQVRAVRAALGIPAGGAAGCRRSERTVRS